MLFITARFAVFSAAIKIQKRQFRQTVLAYQKDELKQMRFDADDLYKNSKGIEWKENNKEVVLNGNYYEVVSIEKKENVFLVNMIEDTKENELFKNFFEQTDHKGQLADCILFLLGMNFVPAKVITLKQTDSVSIKHQTNFTLKSGVFVNTRTEKPPCV